MVLVTITVKQIASESHTSSNDDSDMEDVCLCPDVQVCARLQILVPVLSKRSVNQQSKSHRTIWFWIRKNGISTLPRFHKAEIALWMVLTIMIWLQRVQWTIMVMEFGQTVFLIIKDGHLGRTGNRDICFVKCFSHHINIPTTISKQKTKILIRVTNYYMEMTHIKLQSSMTTTADNYIITCFLFDSNGKIFAHSKHSTSPMPSVPMLHLFPFFKLLDICVGSDERGEEEGGADPVLGDFVVDLGREILPETRHHLLLKRR